MYPRGQKAGTGHFGLLCASRAALFISSTRASTCSSSATRCPQPICRGTQASLTVRTERRYGRAVVLAEGAWVRQPACGTEDSRCACRATCRRSAHGRRAGTWAALSPFAPGQSPPGRLSSCWPAQQQQNEAAWCSREHHLPSGIWHSLILFHIPRHAGSALIGMALQSGTPASV